MVNGRAGKGTRHFDKEEANQLAEELNAPNQRSIFRNQRLDARTIESVTDKA